jgi:hypothetical protein
MSIDGRSVEDRLEELSLARTEQITLEAYDYLTVPYAEDVISSLSNSDLGTSAAGCTYICTGENKDVKSLVTNLLRTINYYKPLCVKEEEILPTLIEYNKDNLEDFKKKVVLYNCEAIFEKEHRTIGAICKEAGIEILDFIYV